MGLQVVELKTKKSDIPSDFPGILRKIADRIEAGEITAFVGMAVSEEYEFLWPMSLCDSVMLSSLLNHRALERMSGC